MWEARSSSDQRALGTPPSAGWVVARTITWWRASGGKSGRAATAGGVVQASEAPAAAAPAPLRNRLRSTAAFPRALIIAGLVGLGATQDDTGSEGEALGCRGGIGEAAQVEEIVGGQGTVRCWARQEVDSVCAAPGGEHDSPQDTGPPGNEQALKRARMFMITDLGCETQ